MSDDGVIHVIGGGATRVSTSDLDSRLFHMDLICGKVADAISAVATASYQATLRSVSAPQYEPVARQSLSQASAVLSGLYTSCEEMRNDLLEARVIYEAVEWNAAAQMQSLANSDRNFLTWLAVLLPRICRCIPSTDPTLLSLAFDIAWPNDPNGSNAAELQLDITQVALEYGQLASPFGSVRTDDGVQTYQTMLPVPFLVQSILSGFPAFLGNPSGNVDVRVAMPQGTSSLIASARGGRITDSQPIPAEAGVPFSSDTDLDGYLELMETQGNSSKLEDVGHFAVVEHVAPDGSRAFVFVLPGTTRWLPWRQDNPSDLWSNLQLMAGENSDLVTAMDQTVDSLGITENDSIVMISHSQSGMSDLTTAVEMEEHRGPDVDAVITLGSPTGHIQDVPEDMEWLALQHDDDPVPALSGVFNEGTDHHMTVISNADTGGKYPHHLDVYRQMLVDASEAEPIVAEQLAEIEEAALIGQATTSTLYVFEVERQ